MQIFYLEILKQYDHKGNEVVLPIFPPHYVSEIININELFKKNQNEAAYSKLRSLNNEFTAMLQDSMDHYKDHEDQKQNEDNTTMEQQQNKISESQGIIQSLTEHISNQNNSIEELKATIKHLRQKKGDNLSQLKQEIADKSKLIKVTSSLS